MQNPRSLFLKNLRLLLRNPRSLRLRNARDVRRLVLVVAVSAGLAALGSLAGSKLSQDAPVSASQAVERLCNVASVHDGDSMRVQCPGFSKTLPIRLEQIDAPELDQAFGLQSRDFLRALCPVGRETRVLDMGKDIYNRHLGRVFCGDVDVNAALVRAGMAWVYDHYADDPQLYRLQDEARAQRQGLWASRKQPVAPWTFRYQKRNKKSVAAPKVSR